MPMGIDLGIVLQINHGKSNQPHPPHNSQAALQYLLY